MRCRENCAPTLPNCVVIDGAACGFENVTQRRRRGAAFVPEERLGHAAVPGFALSDNAVLTHHGGRHGLLARRGIINAPKRLAHRAESDQDF